MEKEKACQLIAIYGDKFPDYALDDLLEQLQQKETEYSLTSLKFARTKDPTIALVLSLCIGTLGADRLYIGDTMLGILKLITCGGCGVWTVIDWFLIMNRTKEINYNNLTDF